MSGRRRRRGRRTMAVGLTSGERPTWQLVPLGGAGARRWQGGTPWVDQPAPAPPGHPRSTCRPVGRGVRPRPGRSAPGRARRRRTEPPRSSELTAWSRRTEPREVRETCLRGLGDLPDPAAVAHAVDDLSGRPEEVLDGLRSGSGRRRRRRPGPRCDRRRATADRGGRPAWYDLVVLPTRPTASRTMRLSGCALARAAGDQTSTQVPQEPRRGERTLPELARRWPPEDHAAALPRAAARRGADRRPGR